MLGCSAFIISLWALVECQAQGVIHRRFEYKHSFRAPNLAQRDGSIPFWMVTGDAIASGEQLRLAPSMRSRRGIAWNKRPMIESENFEIEIAFKITGQGRIGADGLAVWYTAQQGTLGPVFGSNDFWTGMGLFFDSFDNDGQKNNPFVALMINDGTRQYDHQTDGSQQMLSGCQKDFRNKPFPVRARIEYLRNVLTVMISDGMQAAPRYEICIRAENIFLPKNGFFGVSAATGGLADDHDVTDFSVFSLFTDQQKLQTATLPREEKQKYDAEFERQMQDYERERQKFKEQHPDRVKEDDNEEDIAKYFEDATQRELRLIYESQTAIHQVMQQIEQKLREISQQQNVHTSMLQQASASGGAAQAGGQVIVAGGFQQHEKNEALQTLRDLSSSIRDMKNYVNEIFTRTYNMEQKLTGGTATAAVAGMQPDAAIKQFLEGIQNDVRQIRTSQLAQSGVPGTSCPNSACLTSTFFLVIVTLQSTALLAVLLLKGRPDKAKFY
uniref:L-type lectin-like domain-containing protein n=1 Tax=Parascaris univalens TaxID=6257 RepID=A0A915B1V6_PARUN